jgi:hypothetical protein
MIILVISFALLCCVFCHGKAFDSKPPPVEIDLRPPFKKLLFLMEEDVKLILIQVLGQDLKLRLSAETNKLILIDDPHHRCPKSTDPRIPDRVFFNTAGLHFIRTEGLDLDFPMRVYSAPIRFPISNVSIPQVEIHVTEYQPLDPFHKYDGVLGLGDIKFDTAFYFLLERSKIFSFQNSLTKNELGFGGYWPIEEFEQKRSFTFPMASRNPFVFKFSKVILHESSGCTKEFDNGEVILDPSNAFIEIPIGFFVQNLYLLQFYSEDGSTEFLVPLKRYHGLCEPLDISYSRHNYRPNRNNKWIIGDQWTDLFYDRVHDMVKNQITYHEWRRLEYHKYTPAELYKHGDCAYRKILAQKRNNQ